MSVIKMMCFFGDLGLTFKKFKALLRLHYYCAAEAVLPAQWDLFNEIARLLCNNVSELW